MLLTKILITAFIGGITALDKYSLLILVSEPLIISASVGACFNNIQGGILVGIIWQLMWVGEIPIGAVDSHDSSAGAIVSASLYLNLLQKFPDFNGLVLTISIIAGIIAAYISGEFISDKRRFHSKYSSMVERYALQASSAKIESVFILGLAEQFISGALVTALIFVVFYLLFGWLLSMVPLFWEGLLKYILPGTWGLLSALIINHSFHRKTIPAMILGLIFGYLAVKFI